MNDEQGSERSILHAVLVDRLDLDVADAGRRRRADDLAEERLGMLIAIRIGLWRLLRLFAERRIAISMFAVAIALERHPAAAREIAEAGHELVSHDWRWIN